MGAWIEINEAAEAPKWDFVAPLVGAWIEILGFDFKNQRNIVAPLVGAWIEIIFPLGVYPKVHGRSSRGSVD